MALLDRVWEIAYRRSRPLSVQKDSSEDSLETMSFGDHLEELRTRLIRSLLVVVVFASVALVYQSELMTIVTAPHRKAMLQIESSRVVKALSAEVSELSGESKGLDVQIAGQSLKQAIGRASGMLNLMSGEKGIICRIAIFHSAKFYLVHHAYISALPLAPAIMTLACSVRISS